MRADVEDVVVRKYADSVAYRIWSDACDAVGGVSPPVTDRIQDNLYNGASPVFPDFYIIGRALE